MNFALVFSMAFATASAGEPDPAAIEFFEKKVRPVLVGHCFECHGGGKKLRGGLNLTSRQGLMRGGDTGAALMPGQPEKSLLIRAIRYTDDLKMPPRGKLTDDQVADLSDWVKRGAPWPGPSAVAGRTSGDVDVQARKKSHWAWQPLAHPEPPLVQDKTWPRNPVDRFLLARLEKAGLAPAGPAIKQTLLRRVTFDLAGLPPTRAEINAFLADDSPNAYEKVVDRLLASPAYGERWTRHWLDLVRFAETRGHEYDFEIPYAHGYRDYLIRAFNADVPYDQLVREHVAGDLLPAPRRHTGDGLNESILGTGFWFLGEGKHSPVDIRLDGDERRDNMIDVFAKTFLGLTVACARCHDHKFDAISTRDYYALAGYLQSSRQQLAFIDAPEKVGEPLAKLQRLRAAARARAETLAAAFLEQRLQRLPGDLVDGRLHPNHKNGGELWAPWLELSGLSADQFDTGRRALVSRRLAAGAAPNAGHFSVFADFARDSYRDWFVTGDAFGFGPSRAGEPVLQPNRSLPVKALVGIGAAHSGLASSRLQGALRSRTFSVDKRFIWLHLAGRGGMVRFVVDGYQIIRSPLHGNFEVPVNHGDEFRWHVIDTTMAHGMNAYLEFLDDGDGWLAVDRILFSDGSHPESAPNPVLTQLLDDASLTAAPALARKYQEFLQETVALWHTGKLAGLEDGPERARLLNEFLRLYGSEVHPDQELVVLEAQIRRAEADLPHPRRALAMADGTGLNEYVHVRGSHKNRGPEVPRRLLEAIAGTDQPAPRTGSGRLELVERLLAPNDALLPRVIVNRLWHHHFGRGLVASVDDFGVQGQPPTHPELLDWFAAELVRQGWSLKAMHRLLTTSAAYRMCSQAGDQAEQADPQNLLWHRAGIRRLEAEAIRDALLDVSGRLSRRMYGPGVLPHLTPFMVGRGRPASGPLDGDGRRSLYENVRRNFLNPMFLAFDYPIPFTTIGRRSVSNVPAQALTMLNNPLVVQQARLWADRVRAETDQASARVVIMYEAAFGRTPTAVELADALHFISEQGREYGSSDDPRTWADLAHVLFNVKEFIFLD